MITKAAARSHGWAVRAALSAGERELFSRRIMAQCRKHLDWPSYRRVHLFLPIGKQREVDTWPLLAWLFEAHPDMRVYVPRMRGDNMEHVLVSDQTRFESGVFGIPEPLEGRRLTAGEALDVVLVPLLAFDNVGHRVGYGGGHYDRFLAEQRAAVRVGIAYERVRLHETLAVEPHDVLLHKVITEAGCIEFD